MTETATAARQAWLGLLATAPPGRAAALLAPLGIAPAHEVLRPPELGTVMVRGRAGGTGAAFNLGETTVTRCSIRLASGEVGHGYVQGRRKADAQTAAMIDALMQTAHAPALREAVIEPLAAQRTTRRRDRAAKADATKVDFFTLARGEDP